MSIITIRQAEAMLVEDGLLDRQQGRGTFVPVAVRDRLKILCVVGLRLSQGLQERMGSYHSDLIFLSEQETARRGMEFDTVWLDAADPARVKPYCEKDALREFWGIIFIACGPQHPLLQQTRALGLRYVVISAAAEGERRKVWLDYEEAVRLALGEFDANSGCPPLVLGIDNLRVVVESALREKPQNVTQMYLTSSLNGEGYDAIGYRRTLELHRAGADLSQILVLDDIVAQGVTRALLKVGYAEREIKLIIICGRQEIIPLGLPATYVVHDTAEEVQQAFSILQTAATKRGEDALAWRSGFRVIKVVD